MRKNMRGYIILAVLTVVCFAIFSSRLLLNVNAKDNTMKYYTQIMVEEGDSLWSIANEYMPNGYDIHDYIDELKQLNHINNDTIIAGYTLTVVCERTVN